MQTAKKALKQLKMKSNQDDDIIKTQFNYLFSCETISFLSG